MKTYKLQFEDYYHVNLFLNRFGQYITSYKLIDVRGRITLTVVRGTKPSYKSCFYK